MLLNFNDQTRTSVFNMVWAVDFQESFIHSLTEPLDPLIYNPPPSLYFFPLHPPPTRKS